MSRRLQLVREIQAPLSAGQKVGKPNVYAGEQKVGTVDLVVACNVEQKPARTWLFWLAGIALLVLGEIMILN